MISGWGEGRGTLTPRGTKSVTLGGIYEFWIALCGMACSVIDNVQASINFVQHTTMCL